MKTRVTRSVFISKDVWNTARDMKLNVSAITEKALEYEIAKIQVTIRTYANSINLEKIKKEYRK